MGKNERLAYQYVTGFQISRFSRILFVICWIYFFVFFRGFRGHYDLAFIFSSVYFRVLPWPLTFIFSSVYFRVLPWQ